jgi:hypothetical protein
MARFPKRLTVMQASLKKPTPERGVVSLDSVYGGKRSFDAHLADCGVQCGFGWIGKSIAQVGAAKSNYPIARRAFAEGNCLRSTGQNVEVDLDRAGPIGL